MKDGLHVSACRDLLNYYEGKDGNYVKTTDRDGRVRQELTPFWPALSHPLWVGKSWRARFNGLRTFQSASNFRWASDVHVRVTAYEEIQVPAGTFKTFRIDLEDNGTPAGMSVAGGPATTFVYHTTVWWAPEAGTFVKQVSSDGAWDAELIGYLFRPQK
jgi:hypothetical protein